MVSASSGARWTPAPAAVPARSVRRGGLGWGLCCRLVTADAIVGACHLAAFLPAGASPAAALEGNSDLAAGRTLRDERRDRAARKEPLDEVDRTATLAATCPSTLSTSGAHLGGTDADGGDCSEAEGDGDAGNAGIGQGLGQGHQLAALMSGHSQSFARDSAAAQAALADMHNAVAVELLDRNLFKDAELQIHKALALQPTRPELLYNHGVVLSGLKRHLEAEQAYRAALAQRSDLPAAHFNLARTHMSLANSVGPGGDFSDAAAREGRLRSALHHLEQSVDANSSAKSRGETLKSMEETFYQLGDVKGQWAAYEQFLAIAPQEGLQAQPRDSCAAILAWLEDRLLALPWPGAEEPGAYPSIPSAARSELCSSPMEAPGVTPAGMGDGRGEGVGERFRRQWYIELHRRNVAWSDATLDFVATYFELVHQGGGFYKDSKDDPQAFLSAGRWSLDNDRFAVFLAHSFQLFAEEAAGRPMKLGFVKAALYESGAELPDHHDQILNEVSITWVLRSSPKGVSSSAWPLRLRAAPGAASAGSTPAEVNLTAPVGGGLIFRGRDFLHGRRCCLARGERSLVLLLHYVAADFPEFRCRTLVNVSGVAVDDLLRHDCVRSPSTGGGHAQTTLAVHGLANAPEAVPRAAAGTERPFAPKYLLYNPCATNLDPTYCQGQFNNQVVFLLHALSVARALERTLVLPPFMWMEHQMADKQNWFPFEHFFDVEQLRMRFDAIPLETFLRQHDLASASDGGGQQLWWYFYPPYLVQGEHAAFQGRLFKEYMNLSFARTKRMSPFWEVRMASSGRGDEPYQEREGRSYWTAARLLMGKFRSESEAFHDSLDAVAQPSSWAAWFAEAFGQQGPGAGGREEAALISRQSEELRQWIPIAKTLEPGRGLQPCENTSVFQNSASAGGRRGTDVDVVAFDFAPSYNFRFDRFNFDWELRRSRRALRFRPDLEEAADRAVAALFGDRPFMSLHWRRDGFSHFCRMEVLRHAAGLGRLRFGYVVTGSMCDPSADDVVEAARQLLFHAEVSKFGGLFLATNIRDEEVLLDDLRERLQVKLGLVLRRWKDLPKAFLDSTAMEHVPVLDLLIAARAQLFVGNAVSTFSMNVLMERDLRGVPRNSTAFCGLGGHERWAGNGSSSSSSGTSTKEQQFHEQQK